jgi:hypothetical protein
MRCWTPGLVAITQSRSGSIAVRISRQVLTAAIMACLFVGKAGIALSATPIGYFDGIDGNGAAFGWALDPDVPDRSIEVTITVDAPATSSEPAARADTEAARPDVNAAHHVRGSHGFVIMVPAVFRDGEPHQLHVSAAGIDGKTTELDGSPKPFELSRPPGLPSRGDASVSLNGITVATAARFGGAITSLRWNGKEFVNAQDHGREIQTAWQGNNAGECFNPTEAGSADDGIGLHTTSKVLSTTVTATSITTINNPGFWLKPGQTGPFCGFNPLLRSSWEGGSAINRTPVSSSMIKKRVDIGYLDMPNVLVYNSEITLAPDELAYFPLHFIMLENPAVYLRHEFMYLYRFERTSARIESHPHAVEVSSSPIIAATSDDQYAIGLYTLDIPRNGFPDTEQRKFLGYVFTDWGPVVSLSARIRAVPASGETFEPGTYHYRTFLAIGRMSDVTASLQKLVSSGLSDR